MGKIVVTLRRNGAGEVAERLIEAWDANGTPRSLGELAGGVTGNLIQAAGVYIEVHYSARRALFCAPEDRKYLAADVAQVEIIGGFVPLIGTAAEQAAILAERVRLARAWADRPEAELVTETGEAEV